LFGAKESGSVSTLENPTSPLFLTYNPALFTPVPSVPRSMIFALPQNGMFRLPAGERVDVSSE
jgi:hypothetical protein